MTIKRIKGKDDWSNMRGDCSYTGTLQGLIIKGQMIWLEKDGCLYSTGYVQRVNGKLVRTLTAMYEIND
jgi:hypothetical protein